MQLQLAWSSNWGGAGILKLPGPPPTALNAGGHNTRCVIRQHMVPTKHEAPIILQGRFVPWLPSNVLCRKASVQQESLAVPPIWGVQHNGHCCVDRDDVITQNHNR